MEPHTFTTTGTLSDNSSAYLTDFRISSGTTAAPHTVSFSNPINFTQSTSKQIMQNKVAVFKVTRDKFETITKTEFLKELWVETKNGQSVDFQVARDKDLADYEMSDLSIRTIYSVTF
jgi:ribosomal protein L1